MGKILITPIAILKNAKKLKNGNIPLFTIGIPVFNDEKYLSEALDSVLFQDYPNIEVIIYDNASTDSTPEICQAYMHRKTQIQFKYFRNSENMGAAKNFARVLEEANGKYFTWLASDDLLSSSQYVSKIVNFMEQHTNVVACGCSIRSFYTDKQC